jgi:hypothetical protein
LTKGKKFYKNENLYQSYKTFFFLANVSAK